MNFGRWLAALVVAAAIAAGPCQGEAQMNPDALDSRFNQALSSHGHPYVEARTAILASGASARAFLRAREQNPDWRARLLAEALIGWLDQRALFEECTARVKGKTEIKAPSMTGQTPTMVRIKSIEKLGPPVVPCLLEMLLFSRDYSGPDERDAIFAVLADFKDPRAVDPLIDLVHNGDLAVQTAAAAALGRIDNKGRSAPMLIPIVENPRADLEFRSAAATSLSRMKTPSTADLFRSILASPREDIEFRRRIAYLSGMLGPDMTPALEHALESETDDRLLINALKSLGRVGAPTSLPAIERIEATFPAGPVNESARDAVKAIRQRNR